LSPIVSIIVPCYNAERFVGLLLDSILAQTFGQWECIAVNDGSTDSTLAILKEYAGKDARIRAFDSPNRGAAEARNYAFSLIDSSSAYLSFMDSDDLFVPHALETLMEACRMNPKFVGAHAVADMIDQCGLPTTHGNLAGYGQRLSVRHGRIVRINPREPSDFAAMIAASPYPPGLVLIRRSVAEALNGWDKALWPVNDQDYWIRAARHGNFAFVDQVLVHYRRHDQNASDNFPVLHAKHRLLRSRTYHSPENTPEQKRLVREYNRAWHRLRMSEKRLRLGGSIREGNIREAVRLTAHLAGHALQYFKGTPNAPGQ